MAVATRQQRKGFNMTDQTTIPWMAFVEFVCWAGISILLPCIAVVLFLMQRKLKELGNIYKDKRGG